MDTIVKAKSMSCRTNGQKCYKLEFHGTDTDTDTDTDIFADFSARIVARMSVRDARVYRCTVHDKQSCTRLQNYTIGASLMSVSVSVSVSVPWNSSL